MPAALIRTKAEWLALKPMRVAGILVGMNDGKSKLTVPGRVVDVSGPGGAVMPIAPREALAVTLDDAESSLQRSAALTAKPIQSKSLKKGDLLKGLKVLDMANVIAGPTSALNLAQYGADVIKLDPPYPDHYHPTVRWTTLMIDQGKRSAVIDVKTAPGKEIFRKLVCWADVVVHNILDDTAQRLGVSHERLTAINPNVVTCQMSAYKLLSTSPRTGEHTREILQELGYPYDVIDELIRLNVAYEYFPPLRGKDAFLFPIEE